VRESLFNRGGVAQARYCTPLPFVEWGGGRGCSPWRHPSTAQHVAHPPPYPHSCPGENQGCPSTALHVPYPPRRTHQSWNGGGGDRGCSPWRRPRTALQVAYPPALRKTHHTCNGGGGDKGCSMWCRSSTEVHIAYPPLTSPIPPYPPPPRHVLENQN
jgi:hypothetical protein